MRTHRSPSARSQVVTRLIPLAVLSCVALTLTGCSQDGPVDPSTLAVSESGAPMQVENPDVPTGDTAVEPDQVAESAVPEGAMQTATPYTTEDGDVIAGASPELIAALEEAAEAEPAKPLDQRVVDAASEFAVVYFGQRSTDRDAYGWIDRLADVVSMDFEERLRADTASSGSAELTYEDPQGRAWRYAVDVEDVTVSEWFDRTADDVTVTVSFTAQLLIEETSNARASLQTMFVHVERIGGRWIATGVKDPGDQTPWPR